MACSDIREEVRSLCRDRQARRGREPAKVWNADELDTRSQVDRTATPIELSRSTNEFDSAPHAAPAATGRLRPPCGVRLTAETRTLPIRGLGKGSVQGRHIRIDAWHLSASTTQANI